MPKTSKRASCKCGWTGKVIKLHQKYCKLAKLPALSPAVIKQMNDRVETRTPSTPSNFEQMRSNAFELLEEYVANPTDTWQQEAAAALEFLKKVA